MEKSEFELLMERYVRGQASDLERKKIEAWLDVIGSEDNTYMELTKEEEDRIFHKLTSNVTSVDDITALKPNKKARLDQWMIRIAASLLIITLLSSILWYYAGPLERQLEVVSKNGVEKLILNDGSLVWLRGESKVLYYEKQDERTRYAIFEGEALFEVAKNANQPFVLQCGDVKVQVLGTSFNIKASQEQVEVTVLAGKVNLSSSTDRQGIDLFAGEKAIYKSDGTIEKLTARPEEIALVTANTDYDMQFLNTPMGEVIQRLERKFNVSIEVSDKTIRNCRITVDFTDQSLETSLQLASEVLPITHSTKGKTVTIAGAGCK